MKKIGFTYDLRDEYLAQGFSLEESGEFDSRETIDAIESALQANGYNVERIGGLRNLVVALAAGQRWDMVFNICEGVSGVGREAQVPCLLEGYGIPVVFSASETMVITMDKSLSKLIVQSHGIPTAPFAVISHLSDLARVRLRYPLFAKPLAEGTGKGIDSRSCVANAESLAIVCDSLLDRYRQPVLVEEYLSGRDLTVGILGTGVGARVIGVLEACEKEGAEAGGQSFYNKENCEEVLEYVLVEDHIAQKAAEVALRCWQVLNCRDGGRVDLRCDANGTPHFLEVNPLSGLHPHHSDLPILAAKTGMDHVTLIGEIMNEAVARQVYDWKNHDCRAGI